VSDTSSAIPTINSKIKHLRRAQGQALRAHRPSTWPPKRRCHRIYTIHAERPHSWLVATAALRPRIFASERSLRNSSEMERV